MKRKYQIIKLIKCHFNFCFSKKSSILLISLLVISTIYNFIVIDNIDESLGSNYLFQGYLESTLSFFNFLSILFSIIVFSYSFLTKQDSYLSYLIGSRVTKLAYFYTKIVAIVIYSLLFFIALIISFFIPFFIKKTLYIDSSVVLCFLDALKVMIYYGLISLLLVLAFDNMYVAIIPIVLFIFSTNITLLEEKLSKILSCIIPVYSESYLLISPKGVIITIIMILVIINGIYYYYRD